jgi:hypothetical protein
MAADLKQKKATEVVPEHYLSVFLPCLIRGYSFQPIESHRYMKSFVPSALSVVDLMLRSKLGRRGIAWRAGLVLVPGHVPIRPTRGEPLPDHPFTERSCDATNYKGERATHP